MKKWQIILVAALAIPLAGCVLNGKPKVTTALPAAPQPAPVPPPPDPLSIPQTRADLPPAETVNLQALNTALPQQPLPLPVPPKSTPPAKAPRTTPIKPPETAPTVETTRPPIQEILSPDEKNRLRGSAERHRADVAVLKTQALKRRLNTSERKLLVSIDQFVKQSEQAEKNGDMRLADDFSEKAFILAKELQVGK